MSRFRLTGRNQVEHAPPRIVSPPRRHETDSPEKRNDERVRYGTHAGRGAKRRNRQIGCLLDDPGLRRGNSGIPVERGELIMSEGRRDQPPSQPGNDAYHAIRENAGRGAATVMLRRRLNSATRS